ncbi:hypothetical protein AAGS61_01660 [Lysinibacillus sp. KU-BSD001]|uniref:hypothetical protein n=1 Tax=Lysinibacillus sp. KU-BSD001 TaxID=3141328 RepID=UPI0036E9A7E4
MSNLNDEIVKCSNCNKEIESLDGVDYSQENNAVLCSFNCAVDYYFDVMRSTPLENIIDEMADMEFTNGKLRYKNR